MRSKVSVGDILRKKSPPTGCRGSAPAASLSLKNEKEGQDGSVLPLGTPYEATLAVEHDGDSFRLTYRIQPDVS